MPRDKYGKAVQPEKREGTPEAVKPEEQPSKTPEAVVPAKKTGSDANYARKRH